MDQKISQEQSKEINKAAQSRNKAIGWILLILPSFYLFFNYLFLKEYLALRLGPWRPTSIFMIFGILELLCVIGVVFGIPIGLVLLFKKTNIKKTIKLFFLIFFLISLFLFTIFVLLGYYNYYPGAGKECSDGRECFISGKCVYDASAVCGFRQDFFNIEIENCVKKISANGIVAGSQLKKYEGHCARPSEETCRSAPIYIENGVIKSSPCDDPYVGL